MSSPANTRTPRITQHWKTGIMNTKSAAGALQKLTYLITHTWRRQQCLPAAALWFSDHRRPLESATAFCPTQAWHDQKKKKKTAGTEPLAAKTLSIKFLQQVSAHSKAKCTCCFRARYEWEEEGEKRLLKSFQRAKTALKVFISPIWLARQATIAEDEAR